MDCNFDCDYGNGEREKEAQDIIAQEIADDEKRKLIAISNYMNKKDEELLQKQKKEEEKQEDANKKAVLRLRHPYTVSKSYTETPDNADDDNNNINNEAVFRLRRDDDGTSG